MTANGELRRFIHHQGNAGRFHLRFKRFAPLEQVVVAFDHKNAGVRIEAPDGVDPLGQLVEGAVDEVARDEDEFGTEIVHGGGHLAEDRAAGEAAGVHIANVRDCQALESSGKAANGDGQPADSELFKLPEGDPGQTDGEELG